MEKPWRLGLAEGIQVCRGQTLPIRLLPDRGRSNRARGRGVDERQAHEAIRVLERYGKIQSRRIAGHPSFPCSLPRHKHQVAFPDNRND